jgi:hypothetical protein
VANPAILSTKDSGDLMEQQAIARTPAQMICLPVPSATVVFVVIVCKV